MTLRRTTAAVFAIVLAGALTSCSISGGDVPDLTFDDTVNDAVLQVARDGTTVPVSEVVDVEWDEAALFTEGEPVEAIEEVVGETGLKGKRYVSSPNLIVLRKDGEVVGLIGTSADVFDGEYKVLLGSDAVLAPEKRGVGLVVLTTGP
ncbi:hypothetical protein [Promicromonospora sp. NPDC023805]|uniref:hypothetical protein n=1 Tax=Promicromonospora sp. NPDC023805 TaxID=3154696 RepID=UPI0034051A04